MTTIARSRALAVAAGVMFAAGIALAGLASPDAVLHGFRVYGWDPRLWLMFAGAIVVAVPGRRWLVERGRSLRGAVLRPLPNRPVDARLVVGSIVFGIGWGLAGICPGPAFVAVGSGHLYAVLAFTGMWLGMAFHDAYAARERGL